LIGQKEEVTEVHACGLDKLIYVISGAAVVYGLTLRLGTEYLIRMFRSGDVAMGDVVGRYGYPAVLVVYLVTMIAIAIAYRPVRRTLVWEPRRLVQGRVRRGIRHAAYGIVGGLICCAAAVPVMWGHGGSNVGFLVNTIADAYGMSISSALMVLLLALALPLASEIVFRGIVLRSLAQFVSMPAAVVASALLFTLWWPVLGWYGSVTLGVVSAVLYVRTRTLTASVVANSVLSVGSAVFVLIFAFK
jgi:membrane protease YdiL (CAAX protease family)